MKLTHALRVIEKLVDEAKPPMRLAEQVTAVRYLRPEEVVALTVLVQFTRRVLAVKESVRALARAVSGDDDLNQLPLGGGDRE